MEFDSRTERLAIPAVALTEYLVGIYSRGGPHAEQATELASQFEVLEVTEAIAIEAARLGGECARRGTPVGNMDLLIGATTRLHRATLLTRDADFSMIPGVSVEKY